MIGRRPFNQLAGDDRVRHRALSASPATMMAREMGWDSPRVTFSQNQSTHVRGHRCPTIRSFRSHLPSYLFGLFGNRWTESTHEGKGGTDAKRIWRWRRFRSLAMGSLRRCGSARKLNQASITSAFFKVDARRTSGEPIANIIASDSWNADDRSFIRRADIHG